MTTPPTLPEAVRQGHKGSLAPTGRTGQPQQRCQSAQLPSITSATPITAPPGFHQPRKCIFEATTVGLRSLRLLTLGLSRVLFLKVEIMDKENENAALEATVEMIVANVIRGATEQFLALQKKGKEAEYVAKNIQWTTCKDFTVERGRQQIEEYISTWEVHESWLYWSEFLREEELMYSKRYHYRVLWSIPTRRKPIPQATASVYFVIEISKIKPATLPVEVFFFLESSRLILRPEQCRFREKWLKDIIENKLILKRRLTF